MRAPDPVPHPFHRPERATGVPLVAPLELKALLDAPDPPLLLDVRPERERRLVHLARDRSVPLEQLATQAASLPRDRSIVAYDHLGFGARRAVDFLVRSGFERVAALEGGIDEYARVAEPSLAHYAVDDLDPDLLVAQLPRPDTGCLSYLIGDLSARVGIAVDPGLDVEPFRAFLRSGWRLAAIVETHTHADHLAGHAALHAVSDAPIYLSRRSPAEYPHQAVDDGESLTFGAEELRVIATPGHTRDHLTLSIRGRLFTGDTLLLGGCGRTDLGDGSPEQLWESLTDRLLKFPSETEVYPAHFGTRHALEDRYVSTIGFEKATNEALQPTTREAFVAYMRSGWPPKPDDFDAIVRANLSG